MDTSVFPCHLTVCFRSNPLVESCVELVETKQRFSAVYWHRHPVQMSRPTSYKKAKDFLELMVSTLAPHASAGVRPSKCIRGYSTIVA